MFLVNGIPDLILFDLGATRLFVCHALSKNFDVVPGAVDFPLEVEIVDEHTLSNFMVHWDCMLEMFWVCFLIDLIPISLRTQWSL